MDVLQLESAKLPKTNSIIAMIANGFSQRPSLQIYHTYAHLRNQMFVAKAMQLLAGAASHTSPSSNHEGLSSMDYYEGQQLYLSRKLHACIVVAQLNLVNCLLDFL